MTDQNMGRADVVPHSSDRPPQQSDPVAACQETIMGMRPDNLVVELRGMVETARERHDPTLAISLSVEAVAFLLDRAEVAERMEPLDARAEAERWHRILNEDSLLPNCSGTHLMGYGYCQRLAAYASQTSAEWNPDATVSAHNEAKP